MAFGTGDAILYAVLLLITFFLNLLVFYIIFSLSLKNPRNEDGTIVGISLQKYVKVVLIGFSYGLILILLNLMNAVAQDLTDLTQFAGIIGGLFLAMASVTWPWVVIIIIWLVYIAWNDSTLYKELMKAYEEAGG